MKAYPHLKRWLSLTLSVAVFAGVLAVLARTGGAQVEPEKKAGTVASVQGAGQHAWPMFGGTLSRNMVNLVEKNMPTDWSIDEDARKNVKWVAELGSKAYGGPIVAGGRILMGTNNEAERDPKVKGDKGIMMCFDEASGKFLYQMVFNKLPQGLVNDWPLEGICSAPFIEGDRFYFVSNRCQVVCASLKDGKTIWTKDMIKDLQVFPHNLSVCSPLVVGDRLFTVTANGVDKDHINIPAPQAPSFLVLNKKDGSVLWKNNDPSKNLLAIPKGVEQEGFIKRLVEKGELLMHGQWSNPVYAEANGRPQVIFPGGDGWLRSFDPTTGELIWKFDCNPKNSFYALGGKGTRNDFVATPVVHDNRLYIGVGQDPEHDWGVGHFWCIDITKKGDVSPKNDNFDPKAPENKGSALVWHYGGFTDGAGPKGGKGGKRNIKFSRTISTAAVHDGLCYVADMRGMFFCFDAKTGQKLWDHDVEAPVWSSPYWVDNKVYLGNDRGRLTIFAHGRQKKILNTVDMESAVRATPVAVNGVLLVVNENKLYAIGK
jgi:outer membrane protein assembly factor BamB